MKTKIRSVLKLMRLIMVVTFAFIAFSAFTDPNLWKAPQEADKLENPFANNADAIKKGGKIYGQLCWVCHGKLGKGDGPAGKGLNPPVADHTSDAVQDQSDGAIFWKITNGRGTMPNYSKMLSNTERWQLVSYIRELGK